jgi:hypothetical protein
MSQSKQFNDGRVLRSDDTTLKFCEVKELYMLLKQGDNDIHDLEKLRDIGVKIRAALGSFYDRCEQLRLEARAAMRDGVPPEIADLNYNLKVEALDNSEGAEFVSDIRLKVSEWMWIKDRIKDRKNYSGQDEAVERMLRIHDVVENAKGYQDLSDGQIWVRGEPVPVEVAREAQRILSPVN